MSSLVVSRDGFPPRMLLGVDSLLVLRNAVCRNVEQRAWWKYTDST